MSFFHARQPAYLSVFVQVELEGFKIFLKAQRAHGPKQVIPIDGFPLLPLAFVAGSAAGEQ